jgi:hypothetical protein
MRENLANYTSEKGLITKIYRELKKKNFPKNQSQNEKRVFSFSFKKFLIGYNHYKEGDSL